MNGDIGYMKPKSGFGPFENEINLNSQEAKSPNPADLKNLNFLLPKSFGSY